MGNLKYKKGHIFGNIKLLEDVYSPITYKKVKFKCFCGKEFITRLKSVRDGGTKSCGCAKRKGREPYKHGLSKHRLYGIWNAMKHRCYNKSDIGYDNYGGRGIKVCDEWRMDFVAFYDYTRNMPHSQEKGYSINRINNNGNYEPGNIKFSTQKEQCKNRRPKKAYSNTGHQGVYSRHGKYFASVTYNNKLVHIGTFDALESAVIERREYITKHNVKNKVVV